MTCQSTRCRWSGSANCNPHSTIKRRIWPSLPTDELVFHAQVSSELFAMLKGVGLRSLPFVPSNETAFCTTGVRGGDSLSQGLPTFQTTNDEGDSGWRPLLFRVVVTQSRSLLSPLPIQDQFEQFGCDHRQHHSSPLPFVFQLCPCEHVYVSM